MSRSILETACPAKFRVTYPEILKDKLTLLHVYRLTIRYL